MKIISKQMKILKYKIKINEIRDLNNSLKKELIL